jgi:acyl-coenzyme A thioesterase PaaI-like protein
VLVGRTGARGRQSAADRPPRLRDERGAFEFEPHHCFACGELNEHGLRLVLHTSPEGAWTEPVVDARFQGWEAVAHGGIVCTILDEVMAWAVIGRGTWGVTARMAVKFRGPIRTGTAIRAEGWVVEQKRRAVRAEGRIIDRGTGDVLATGESTFVALPAGQLERLKARYGMRRVEADARAGDDSIVADRVEPSR